MPSNPFSNAPSVRQLEIQAKRQAEAAPLVAQMRKIQQSLEAQYPKGGAAEQRFQELLKKVHAERLHERQADR